MKTLVLSWIYIFLLSEFCTKNNRLVFLLLHMKRLSSFFFILHLVDCNEMRMFHKPGEKILAMNFLFNELIFNFFALPLIWKWNIFSFLPQIFFCFVLRAKASQIYSVMQKIKKIKVKARLNSVKNSINSPFTLTLCRDFLPFLAKIFTFSFV